MWVEKVRTSLHVSPNRKRDVRLCACPGHCLWKLFYNHFITFSNQPASSSSSSSTSWVFTGTPAARIEILYSRPTTMDRRLKAESKSMLATFALPLMAHTHKHTRTHTHTHLWLWIFIFLRQWQKWRIIDKIKCNCSRQGRKEGAWIWLASCGLYCRPFGDGGEGGGVHVELGEGNQPKKGESGQVMDAINKVHWIGCTALSRKWRLGFEHLPPFWPVKRLAKLLNKHGVMGEWVMLRMGHIKPSHRWELFDKMLCSTFSNVFFSNIIVFWYFPSMHSYL